MQPEWQGLLQQRYGAKAVAVKQGWNARGRSRGFDDEVSALSINLWAHWTPGTLTSTKLHVDGLEAPGMLGVAIYCFTQCVFKVGVYLG
jgi:hypothetical protein